MGKKDTEQIKQSSFLVLEPQEGRRNLFKLGWKERSWNPSQEVVTRTESRKTNKHSLVEEVMWMAKNTEVGDSWPVVG